MGESFLNPIQPIHQNPSFPFKEVLQHFAQTGRTGQFHLRSGTFAGQIFLANGLAVYAETPGQSGEHAFLEMLSWPDITYTWVDNHRAPSVNMSHTVQDLLVRHIMMEGTSCVRTGQIKFDPTQSKKINTNETRTITGTNNFFIISLEIQSPEISPFTFVVKSNQVRIGREQDNDLPLLDTSVSRRHALIVAAQDALLVRDLGSKNGTSIDGQPISQGIARAGQIITIGEVNCRLQVAPVPQQPAAAAATVASFAVRTTHLGQG